MGQKAVIFLGVLLFCISVAQIEVDASEATPEEQPMATEPWHEKVDAEWGGHIKVRGTVSWPDEESFFQPVGTDPYYDGSAEVRVNNRLSFEEWGIFETHYEAVLSGGGTRRKLRSLERLYPDLFNAAFVASRPVEDDRRFMDLTKTIDEDDGHILYHRLDRLSLKMLHKWAVVGIGRQAVTWGNGLLFNPMDLFNPFSPTDIERDYKTGDDMVSAQFPLSKMGDFQFLYVPRRDPVCRDVEWEESSLAGKLHLARDTTEFDILAAEHYKDTVVGLGCVGYLGGAAWRLDATWTFLEDSGKEGYLSLVANMDYSWTWWKRNFYGFLEFYFNGLCDDQYTDAFADPEISERLERGELYTLGRTYLDGHIRLELHPLFNVYLTVINNLADPSGALQPRAAWDITQAIQITFGGTIYYGGRGTEYGGFRIPGTNFLNKAPDSAFLWLTYFY